jgi:hypothetical protein
MNKIKFFIIYVPSQQPQGQLQTQHSVDTSKYIMNNHIDDDDDDSILYYLCA